MASCSIITQSRGFFADPLTKHTTDNFLSPVEQRPEFQCDQIIMQCVVSNSVTNVFRRFRIFFSNPIKLFFMWKNKNFAKVVFVLTVLLKGSIYIKFSLEFPIPTK